MIMVKDLSRLGRNHTEVNKYIEDIFPSLNVRVFSINDNYLGLTSDHYTCHIFDLNNLKPKSKYSRKNN